MKPMHHFHSPPFKALIMKRAEIVEEGKRTHRDQIVFRKNPKTISTKTKGVMFCPDGFVSFQCYSLHVLFSPLQHKRQWKLWHVHLYCKRVACLSHCDRLEHCLHIFDWKNHLGVLSVKPWSWTGVLCRVCQAHFSVFLSKENKMVDALESGRPRWHWWVTARGVCFTQGTTSWGANMWNPSIVKKKVTIQGCLQPCQKLDTHEHDM